jgi:MFS family permease
MHVASVALIQGFAFATVFILPILARKQFGANDWQTLILTAAPTILFSLSIFWNDLYSRLSLRKYLMVYWVVACVPLASIAVKPDLWWLIVCHLVACIGGAGYHPAAGELLNAIYPAATRGRMYSVVSGSTMIAGALIGLGLGEWLHRDANAFRLYLPIAAGAQLLGIMLTLRLFALLQRGRASDAPPDGRTLWNRVVEPITHTREVLVADPVFARYEAAYMVYGIGWMVCYALLPILVTDKLKLDYDQISRSTQVAYQVALVCMLWPAGLLMDRLGAVRSTGLSFALLTLYPIGLMLVGNDEQLLGVSAMYGIAHAGASVGWMLGPVALAPSKEKVAQYVAIHATMVGIRGKLFQGLGVGLYVLTHSFAFPLTLAAVAFAVSAWQMWRLDARMKVAKARALAAAAIPAAAITAATPATPITSPGESEPNPA